MNTVMARLNTTMGQKTEMFERIKNLDCKFFLKNGIAFGFSGRAFLVYK